MVVAFAALARGCGALLRAVFFFFLNFVEGAT